MSSTTDTQDNNFHATSVYNLITKSNKEFATDLGMDKEPSDKENIVSPSEYPINRYSNNSSTPSEENRKSLMNRIFSPMDEGSLRGSIFAMSSLALGTGCLALPCKFGQMSFVVALVMLVIGSICAYWSLVIMIEASRKTNTMDYSRLAKESLGPKMALLLDIIILIYIFGILISYQVISKYSFLSINSF
jgi:hypothetical protein